MRATIKRAFRKASKCAALNATPSMQLLGLWAGTSPDGVGLKPNVVLDWSYADARDGVDRQLERAASVAGECEDRRSPRRPKDPNG